MRDGLFAIKARFERLVPRARPCGALLRRPASTKRAVPLSRLGTPNGTMNPRYRSTDDEFRPRHGGPLAPVFTTAHFTRPRNLYGRS